MEDTFSSDKSWIYSHLNPKLISDKIMPTAKPIAKPGSKPAAKPVPKAAPKAVVDWKDTVKKLLEQLRPSLQADGGDLELVDIENDGTVSIRLQGHCAGCPYTLYDS